MKHAQHCDRGYMIYDSMINVESEGILLYSETPQ